jgi:hypothetical protein
VSGGQAGAFTTQSQTSGQHAFAAAPFAWPATNVVEARAMVQLQLSSVQYTTKLFALEDQGPYSWGTRAGFETNAQGFVAMLTDTNGFNVYVDTGAPYVNGQWYELAIVADQRTSSPVFIFMVNGNAIYTFTDAAGGPDQDHPARLDVGLGPGNWGAAAGTVDVDDVKIWNAG